MIDAGIEEKKSQTIVDELYTEVVQHYSYYRNKCERFNGRQDVLQVDIKWYIPYFHMNLHTLPGRTVTLISEQSWSWKQFFILVYSSSSCMYTNHRPNIQKLPHTITQRNDGTNALNILLSVKLPEEMTFANKGYLAIFPFKCCITLYSAIVAFNVNCFRGWNRTWPASIPPNLWSYTALLAVVKQPSLL